MTVASKQTKLIILGLLVCHALLLVWFASMRLMDNDEGFYLSAAREVAQGRLLYSDFFYPQMPYYPILIAPLTGGGFASIMAARAASVAVAIAAAVVFLLLLRRFTKDLDVAAGLFFLYAFSGLIISFHSVVKPYPWTDFLLLAAFAFLFLPRQQNSFTAIGAAMAAALAVNMRLVLVPVLPAVIAIGALRSDGRMVVTTLLMLSAVVLVSMPTLRLWFYDPERFYFNNLGFHLIRDVESPSGPVVLSKLKTIAKMLINPQLLATMILFVAAVWNLLTRRSGFRFIAASVVATILVVVYLIPAPIHQQYFVQAIPFVLLGSVPVVERLKPFIMRRWRIGIIAAIYLLGVIPYIVIFIGGARPFDNHSMLSTIREVGRFIKDSSATAPVLADLPGLALAGGRDVVDRTEFVGYAYPLPFPAEDVARYHLATPDYLNRIMALQIPEYIIVLDTPATYMQAACDSFYVLVEEIDRYRIYGRK